MLESCRLEGNTGLADAAIVYTALDGPGAVIASTVLSGLQTATRERRDRVYPMEPITIRYSEALVRRAVRAFWLRAFAGRACLAFAVMAIMVFALNMSTSDSWSVPAMGALMLFVLVFTATTYVVYLRSSLDRFRRMNRPEATLELHAHTFKIASDVGSLETRWDVITQVWRFPDFWLLFFDRGAFFTLPLADVDPAVQAFIVERVQAHGGNVSAQRQRA